MIHKNGWQMTGSHWVLALIFVAILFVLLALSCRPPTATAPKFSDDFNRADETPLSGGGNWNSGVGPAAAINLNSNAAQGPSGSSGLARVATPAFANNQKSTITLAATVIEVAPAVRIQGSADCSAYIAYLYNDTTVKIFKTDSSFGSVQIGADYTISAVAAGNTLGISASGKSTTTLEVFRNGVSQGTRTDSSSPYTGGQPGLMILSAERVEAFSATDL
jgi:hypothetical protein